MKRIVFTILVGFTFLILISFTNAYSLNFNIAGPPKDDVDTYPATSIFLTALQTGTIHDLNLFVSITPYFADDVNISLTHGSTTVLVYDGIPETWDAYIKATFDDQALNPYPVQGTVDGTFKPSPGLLSAFNGLELSGLWELRIWDDYIPGDGNDLLAWNISGTVPEPATLLLLGAGLLGLLGLRRKFKK